ncbi:MAG TPA: copper amine oxidase N-terminal domain-containing protein [Candidatus Baltobacteraceae bacterium]|nr:copper amine oxidase N-terminal domain-containing protein [Candidatus Baltobacteraceae bacterium]
MFLSRFGRCAAAALAVAFAASSAPALAAAPPPKKDEAPVRVIAISVNGEDLAPDPAPRVEGSRLLVPIVRIYSALGINVARHGGTLVASAPARRITLRVGSRRATVDARTVFLDSPVVEIDGATYVPLRFVADSLGAQVAYDPKAERVEVVSLVVGRTPGLEQRIAGGSTQIVGTVSAVDLNSAPESITVTRGPSERTIAITSDARIVVQDVVTRTSAAASLDDIHVGDAVSVVMRKDGRVDAVVARYASRAGTIAAVSPTAFVLQTGYVVTPDKTTEITLNGRPATLSDLKTGDSVTVRLNPDTGEKRQIIVARAVPSTPTPAGSAQITSFGVQAAGALRAGESFTVTLHGTPGGKATFDIGSYVTALPLPESPSDPGTYTTTYTVPQGVNFGRTSIYGHLVVGASEAPRAEAPQLVAVTTTPPQIVDIAPGLGQTVNNDQPSIYATYRSPSDVGIDASKVQLEVNGLDVTAASTRTDQFITYIPGVALPDGPVTVRVTVYDAAGNRQVRQWTFTIRTR